MSNLSQIKTGLGFIITSFFRPSVIVLEMSNACNADCVMCPRGKLDPRSEMMDFRLVKKVVEEAKRLGIKDFQLSFFGEPLLNPELAKATAYIKRLIPNASIMISTNGAYLTKDRAEDLMRAGIDLFKVSIEGSDKQTYEKVRVGLNWETLLQNMADLRELIASKKYKTRLMVYGLKLKAVDYNLKSYVRFWRNYTDEVYLRNEHDLRIEKFHQKLLPCHQPFSSFIVLTNGRVSPCGQDWFAKLAYGDVKKNSIATTWFSPAILKYRILHLLGMKKLIGPCRTCKHYPMSGSIAEYDL